MIEPWLIYALLDQNGIPFYIGATRNFLRRQREHKKKLGYRPDYKILQTGTGDRNEAEHEWIELYRRLGYPLLNKTSGGNGCQTASQSTRLLLSRIGKGRKKPQGFGSRVSSAQKGIAKNWSPEGKLRVKSTQFNKGFNLWASLSENEQRILVNKRKATRALASPEEINDHLSKLNEGSKRHWASMTKEQRSAHGMKVAGSRKRNHTPEELSAIASKNAKAVLNKTGARQRLSNQIKQWWAQLTPEAKAEYVARRADRIRAAKAAQGK